MKKRQTALLAAAILTLAACGGGSDGEITGGIAALDTVAPTGDDAQDADGEAHSASDAGSDDSDGEPTEEEVNEAFEAYQKCAEDLGLGDLFEEVDGDGVATEVVVGVDTGGEGGAFDDDAFERLQAECEPLIADVVPSFELSPEQEAAQRDAELEFARCMREAGVDIPDPSGDGGLAFEIDIDSDPDELEAAFSECDSVFDELFDEQFGDS